MFSIDIRLVCQVQFYKASKISVGEKGGTWPPVPLTCQKQTVHVLIITCSYINWPLYKKLTKPCHHPKYASNIGSSSPHNQANQQQHFVRISPSMVRNLKVSLLLSNLIGACEMYMGFVCNEHPMICNHKLWHSTSIYIWCAALVWSSGICNFMKTPIFQSIWIWYPFDYMKLLAACCF